MITSSILDHCFQFALTISRNSFGDSEERCNPLQNCLVLAPVLNALCRFRRPDLSSPRQRLSR